MQAEQQSEREAICARITAYLSGGGLFNPELANHEAVRDLLIDCRAALSHPSPMHEAVQAMLKARDTYGWSVECDEKINALRGLSNPGTPQGWKLGPAVPTNHIARLAALQEAYDAMFKVRGDKATLFDAQAAVRALMTKESHDR